MLDTWGLVSLRKGYDAACVVCLLAPGTDVVLAVLSVFAVCVFGPVVPSQLASGRASLPCRPDSVMRRRRQEMSNWGLLEQLYECTVWGVAGLIKQHLCLQQALVRDWPAAPGVPCKAH